MDERNISKDIRELKRIFADIPEAKKSLVEGLIENAAFMRATLADLQEDIKENGAVIVQKNGNGFVMAQENPAQRSYNVMIGKYTACIRQLTELLPDSKADGVNRAGEALAAFVAKGKPKVELR